MKIYFDLFWSFFKIGLFTFGGGYAMLPMIQKDVVGHGWATDDEILDYYAIGQVTPGIIAINVSTFVGYRTKGIFGAICTMFGMILPSLMIISSLAYGLSYVWENPMTQHAFAGVRLMIPALLGPIIVQMIKKGVCDRLTLLILISCFLITYYARISPVLIVVSAALIGIVACGLKAKKS